MKKNDTTNTGQSDTAPDYYTEQSLWRKIKKYAKSIGEEALEKILTLYYCFKDPATPRREKTIILGALGYFIMPFDAMPDLLPGGWADDLGVLALAIAKVTSAINDTHIEKAKENLNKLLNKA
ncbi:DUF1232 domain-containing protein [Kangiella sp. HD9-110m-PIT-SAG06]|nr:DUF1232 domain-containing protein [Kangiella sp. HD9-110m-PIT-SAG06]